MPCTHIYNMYNHIHCFVIDLTIITSMLHNETQQIKNTTLVDAVTMFYIYKSHISTDK